LSAVTPDATLASYATATGGRPAAGPGGLSKAAWIKIGTIALLMGAIFWPNLRRLWFKTNPLSNHPDAGNWQHAIAVPLIGLYYLYANREQLLAAPIRSRRLATGRRQADTRMMGWMFAFTWVLPVAVALALGLHKSYFGPQLFLAITFLFANFLLSLYVPSFQLGLFVMVEGLAIAMYGIHPGQNDFLWDFGMVVTLFGVVLMLTGWDVMKVAWFPIAFLVCALPWPGLVYSWIAGPLQTLAARAAVLTLRFTGVDAVRSGTKMLMMEADGLRVLNVAEACAGLKSLMTFITVAAAVGFLSNRPMWQKIFITVSAVPIAIFCNVLRVTGQGLIDHYWSRELAEGFAHQFVGLVMLIPAFLMILLVAWILDHLFLDEIDEDERQRLRMSGGAARQEKKIIQIQRPAVAGVAAGAGAGAGASVAPVAPRPVPTPPRPGGFPRAAGGGVRPPAANPAAAPPQQVARPQGVKPAAAPAQTSAQPAAKPQAAKPAATHPPAPQTPKPAAPKAPQPPQQGRDQ
jgi:exosortase